MLYNLEPTINLDFILFLQPENITEHLPWAKSSAEDTKIQSLSSQVANIFFEFLFLLHWVFVAVRGLSLVVASGG